jgi:hypothetical protein
MRTGHEYIADMLETLEMPGVVAVTIFEHLQDELGREFLPDSVRRMLERRIAKWRALHGEDKKVFFRQRHLRRFRISLSPTASASPSPAALTLTASTIFGWLAAAVSMCE